MLNLQNHKIRFLPRKAREKALTCHLCRGFRTSLHKVSEVMRKYDIRLLRHAQTANVAVARSIAWRNAPGITEQSFDLRSGDFDLVLRIKQTWILACLTQGSHRKITTGSDKRHEPAKHFAAALGSIFAHRQGVAQLYQSNLASLLALRWRVLV